MTRSEADAVVRGLVIDVAQRGYVSKVSQRPIDAAAILDALAEPEALTHEDVVRVNRIVGSAAHNHLHETGFAIVRVKGKR